MKKQGLALIVVIGILGVLAVLVVAFMAMAQLERRASQQRINSARAYLLARSGIEDALARLDLGQDPTYGGENWDASSDGLLSFYEAAEEVHHRTGIGTPADIDGCPVRHAMRPSFHVRATGNPAVVSVEGRDRGYSGKLSDDYAKAGNAYALKAGAEGSEGRGFYINGGDPAAPPLGAGAGYNAVLRRMLGTLAKAITEENVGNILGGGLPGDPVGLAGGVILTEADGWALVGNRPATGWKDWDQVRKLALGGLPGVSDLKLAALKPFLTLSAWTDRKVIAPNAVPDMLGKSYQSRAQMARDHRQDRPGSLAPDFERINGKIVGRAPVDLSWAKHHKAALIALLGNLKGLYLDETTAKPITGGDWIGTLRAAELTLSTVPDPTDICHKVATRILTSTSALNTWSQWDDFCDALPDDDFLSAQDYLTKQAGRAWDSPAKQLQRQAARDLLKANFNPNSDLNKFNPNASLWRSVDKQDLLVTSTEFSLLPAGVLLGHQQVESAGRVVGTGGRLLALRALKAAVVSPPPLRLTTQKEFVCEDLGALDIAGDETGIRLPGRAPFISRSAGACKTWGHALGLPGLLSQGAALQTYPEPCVDPGSGLTQNPADYDGCIQSATVETAAGDAYHVGTRTQAMMFLARYTTCLDLDVAAAFPANPQARLNQPDAAQVATAELGLSLLDASKLNSLHPDGCYAEKDRAPAYLDQGNANGFHGVMSFWIKTGHAPLTPNTNRGHPFVKWTNFADKTPASGPNQFFFLGDMSQTSVSTSGGVNVPVIDPRDPDPIRLDHIETRVPWRLSDWLMSEAAARPNWDSPVDPIEPGPIGGGNIGGSTSFSDTSYLVCQFEIGHADHDGDMEHRFQIQKGLVPHRWQLLSTLWNFRAPQANDTARLLLDAGTGSNAALTNDYVSGRDADPTFASDITADDLQGPHRISLGRGHPDWEAEVSKNCGSGADATFGEFALYDFGGAGPGGALPPDYGDILSSSQTLASARFKEGRYYKESVYHGLLAYGGTNRAAEWFSAPIFLGGVRIRGLAWTQVVPKELPQGRIGFELLDASGTAYAADLGGNQLLSNPAFTPVNRVVRGAFRLHAVFQPNLADPQNTPILDPLTLDDVTVLYEPVGGLRVLSFGEGEDG